MRGADRAQRPGPEPHSLIDLQVLRQCVGDEQDRRPPLELVDREGVGRIGRRELAREELRVEGLAMDRAETADDPEEILPGERLRAGARNIARSERRRMASRRRAAQPRRRSAVLTALTRMRVARSTRTTGRERRDEQPGKR